MRLLSVPFYLAFPITILAGSLSVNAQIIGDNSLSNPTQIKQQGTILRITEGTQSGRYLFHSFQDFSLRRSNTALFVSPTSTKGIIARVTGKNPSLINGILKSSGKTDVFFFNSNGIIFGNHAQLQIGGSFIGSTAEQIQFNNGTRFQTNNKTSTPQLLKISTPIGLQFGPRANPIRVKGPGHGLAIDPDSLEVIPQNRPIELLRTQPNTSLSLIGGSLTLSGGNLQSSGGRIYLGAIGPNQFLPLQKDNLGWKSSKLTGNQFEDILLENSASLITSGNGGGEIQLQGRYVDILDGSTLLANSFGTQSGQGIKIDASKGSLISGVWIDPQSNETQFPSSIFAEVGLDQRSNGGSINIHTPQLEISDGGQVSTSTFGFGQGGDIKIQAKDVSIYGGSDTFGSSGLYLDVGDELTEGNGGNLDLKVQQLNIANGGTISASTFGPGQSGLINVQGQVISLEGGAPGLGASSILAQVEDTGSALGVKIKSDRLSILGGAQISTSTFGSGNGGLLQVNSPKIRLDGSSPSGSPGGLFSIVDRPGTGHGGALQVMANRLVLRNGAEINSSTRFRGDAGNILIQAKQVNIDDRTAQSTGVFSAVEQNATGQGATLSINTQNLSLAQGGQVVSGTLGEGDAGDILINADRTELQGENALAKSGIFASALNGNGGGGDISIQSGLLSIQDGATVNVSNFPSQNSSFRPGRGAAGNIIVAAKNIVLQDQGSINASTAVGDRGNLTLDSDLLLLSNQSQIKTDTSSTIGGNIKITTQRLFGLGNSDITANASQGQGGQVNITANKVFGLDTRSQLSPLSDITASSDRGSQFAGTVQLNILDPKPTSQRNLSGNDIIDASQLIARSCFQRIAAANQGKFVLKGSGGIASQPYAATHSFFNTLSLASPSRNTPVNASTATTSLISANQWMALPNGKFALGRTC